LNKLVGIIAGNRADAMVLELAKDVLVEVNVPTELIVLSDYSEPIEYLHTYALSAECKGIELIIAGESDKPFLIPLLTSTTTIPIIHVPIKTSETLNPECVDKAVIWWGKRHLPYATTLPGDGHVAGLWAAQKLAVDHRFIYDKLIRLSNA
jgi:phosphoribosylcarboxyaminoimidazole (NCAIR) mutase